ncbi:MAG: hypothetical protein OEY01_12535, partial [Desulfobulbaceae bacterium]|nr:hypothetical protein [Desulfobulbaceae bacterium]
MNLPEIITIVAHDAGGAEILASYVAQNNVPCRLVLEGPAVDVFKRRFGSVEILTLEEGISAGDWCLCGTGWQSDLEFQAIKHAQNNGKHVVAFLDHWVNYPERFVRDGIQHFPDEIWVGDIDAKRLAHEEFPGLSIKLVANPYFIYITRQLQKIPINQNLRDKKKKGILFVCENISDHSRLRYGDERYWGYTEFDAIEYFLKNIDKLGETIDKVVIRPHPTDSVGKYDRIIA